MHEGETGPQVLVAIASQPDTYGVGALSGLRGEVTIVDGTAWLAYPGNDGTIRVQRDPPGSSESATLLATARVPRWRSVTIATDIGPDSLEDAIEALAGANGIDVEKPFPLLVEGIVSEVAWHVLAGRKISAGGGHHADHLRDAASGTIREAPGLLVGFFSKHHQGVFTHMGQRSHLHVLTADGRIMGHADHAGVRAGGKLQLPAPPSR